MPNSRRRRFSVQNDFGGRESSKMQNGSHNRYVDHPAPGQDVKLMADSLIPVKSFKPKNMHPSSSKNSTSLESVPESESSSPALSIKIRSKAFDKDVTASSSNIDLLNVLDAIEGPTEQSLDTAISNSEMLTKKRDTRPVNRDKTPLRRDKHPRQHRVKVRSPKRRMPIQENQNKTKDDNRQSVGTITDWVEKEVVNCVNVPNEVESIEGEERQSDHSLGDMCRICHGGDALSPELGPLISACSCRGTVGRVHVKCLERWLTESGKSRCELCGTRFVTRRVHRYGVLRAMILWILSQNAKQLMVDSLGIMLMSPLAVLAAWLSGRTLAGLMTQDIHVTPWPLASTFVLACMTLVCYYCWIVSAATRHALGWWIWYRSQYEVRLQFQDNED